MDSFIIIIVSGKLWPKIAAILALEVKVVDNQIFILKVY